RPLRSNGAEERDSDGRSRPPMKLATLRPAGLNNRGRPDLRSMNTDYANIARSGVHGFRARRFAAPRNDGVEKLSTMFISKIASMFVSEFASLSCLLFGYRIADNSRGFAWGRRIQQGA